MELSGLNFGVPKQRNKKETSEKYPNIGVITLLPTGDKLSRKMELNTKALELLEIESNANQISFSFSGDDIFVVNTSNSSAPGLKIGKTNNSVSDKKHYDYIKKMFESAEEDTLELFFHATENEFNGRKVFRLSSTTTMEVDYEEPATEHIIEDEAFVDDANPVEDRQACPDVCYDGSGYSYHEEDVMPEDIIAIINAERANQ